MYAYLKSVPNFDQSGNFEMALNSRKSSPFKVEKVEEGIQLTMLLPVKEPDFNNVLTESQVKVLVLIFLVLSQVVSLLLSSVVKTLVKQNYSRILELHSQIQTDCRLYIKKTIILAFLICLVTKLCQSALMHSNSLSSVLFLKNQCGLTR